MPQREWNTAFTPLGGAYHVDPPPAPSFYETMEAGFRMENDVVAAWDILHRPEHKVDDSFNVAKQLQTDKVDQERWNDYIGVRNLQEYKERQARIAAEETDRQTLAASGWNGTVAAITAGVLSPTTLIPVAGGATKARSIANAALSVAGATMLQESALHAAQETRTAGETTFSIAASAVLGGILGAAARGISQADLDRVATDMAVSPGERYGGSLSSARATPEQPDAGKFAYAPGIDTISRMGPITRGIQQSHAPKVNGVKIESPVLRAATAQFGDAGMLLQGNKQGIAAAPGGAIEDLVVAYNRYSADHVQTFEKEYNDYFFNGAAPMLSKAPLTALGKSGKLTKEEFAEAVTRSIWTGQAHEINQVNKAAAKAKEIFDLLYKEAQEVGIYKKAEETSEEGAEASEKIVGDVGYAFRDWQPDQVNRGYNELLGIFTQHYEKKLNEQFQKGWLKFMERQKRTNQLIDDLSTNEEDAQKLLANLRQEIGTMEKNTDGVAQVDEEIAAIKAQASDVKDRAKLKELAKQRRALIKEAGNQYPEYKAKRGDLARRLHNITRSRGLMKMRQRKKLETIDKNEELSMKVLNRAARRGQRLLKFLQGGSDKNIKKALKEFRDAFEVAGKAYDHNEEKIAKLIEGDDPDTSKLFGLEDRQQTVGKKMDDILAKIDTLKNTDMTEWRAEVQTVLDDILEPYNKLIMRRGAREDRLLEAAKKLDPKLAEARVAKLGRKVRLRDKEALEYWKDKGGFAVDMKTGSADFSHHAKKISEEVIDRIRNANGRLAWADLIREKRGPEYARVLDIASDAVARFLETDINRLIVSYVKTLGADITVSRRFGSPNMTDTFEKLLEEERFALQDLPRASSDGTVLEGKALDDASEAVTKFYRDSRNDLETLLMRVRHTRGVPKDPQSWAARGARLALNINTARFMGSVLISSVADPARWVMKYGLTNVFRDGLAPMIANMKATKMNWREAQLAGTALDVVLHSRARQIFDVFDDNVRGSKFEKGIEWSATKIGVVGLFDYWTSAMKQFTSGLAVAKLMRNIEVVMSTNPGKRELEKATQYLANKNLTPEHMKIIWRNVTSRDGGGKVDGVWLPNTENWPSTLVEDADALRAFRAALVSDIDDTIVTPGLERPSWMDSSLPAKLLAQFKSFGMSSTFKTTMAGLQARDMAFVNGVAISLGLGYLSYYLWARSVGGRAEAEMENAGPDKWADEAISRSGVLGVFDEIQRAAQQVPYLKDYASFSKKPTTRREGGDFVDAVLGPTGDLLERVGGAVVNIDNNPQSSVHSVRAMLPWQNLFWLRRAFDNMEQSLVHGLGLEKGKQ